MRGRKAIHLTIYLLAFLFVVSGCTSPGSQSPPATSEPSISNIPNQEISPHTGNSKVGETVELIKTYEGFSSPTAVAIDKAGSIYVSNWGGNTVTKIDTEGNKTEFAEDMSSPAGLAFDETGNLYVSDYSDDIIYRVTPTGEKTVFMESSLNTPTGISFNKDGELLISNRGSNDIIKVTTQGEITALFQGMNTPVGVVEDRTGNLIVTNYGGSVKKIASDRKVTDFSTEFGRPGVGIDVGPNGEIFAADNGDGCVRQIFSDGTTRIVVENIGGCVGVTVHNDILYVSSWNNDAVYAYSIK